MRLSAIAWRGLLSRPLRTALSIIGVALGVAVVTATIVVGSASEQALESVSVGLLGRADVRLRAFADEGFGPRTVQALRGLPSVAAAAPVSERRLTVSTAPGQNERVFTLLVLGIDPTDDVALRDIPLRAGLPLSPDSPTDALVPASWASANGLGLGDALLLSGRRPQVPPLRIVGLMDDTGFSLLERGEVIVASRETLDEAFEVPSPVRYIDLDLGDSPTPAQIEQVTATLDEPFVLETPADLAARFAPAREAFIGTAFLFGFVSLVVGAFLVGNTLAMTVGERTRELGLLRAAGTTARQVVGLVVRQALALGVAGGAGGVLLGLVLAAALTSFLASTRAVLAVGLPLPIGGLLAAVALGVVVTLIGAVVPALRASALSPLEALRASHQPERSLSDRLGPLVAAEIVVAIVAIALLAVSGAGAAPVAVFASLGLLLGGALAAAWVLEPIGRFIGRPFEWFFGAQGMLGRLNLSRDRVRTGLTVGAMMIALATVVALGTVAESARAATEWQVASILPGGRAIRTTLPVDVESFRPTFEAIDGVSVASPVLEAPVVRVTDGGGREEAAIAGIDPNVFQDADALIISGATRAEAFDALRAGGSVLLPAAYAAREGIDVGDVLTLGVPGGSSADVTVAGLVEYSIPGRTPDGALLVSSADARDLFGATTASLWILVPQSGVAAAAVDAAVREAAVTLAAQPLAAADLADEVAGPLERLAGLFDVLALVAVVIAALGIVNTLGVGVAERVREIAILRSHGMTVGQVQAMVVSEAAIMGAIAGLLAIATGLLVALALVGSLSAGGSDAAIRLPWGLLAGVVLVGTGVAALAGLYPARVAASMPIVGNLKHFE
ncbi:MAG TPA: FtsX-like permease family protein [Candidatus Limnocylindria bacterium]|nr:FtsX-like permease family protein [Candidatus Limnocylindria bacterium]